MTFIPDGMVIFFIKTDNPNLYESYFYSANANFYFTDISLYLFCVDKI